ncbi:MAG TPA: rod shape-determining protein MreD [Thermoleophilaceae bacterium]|jgi:rod shape-determining protein MreD|nr:rod shape-determining protein MreD [Thermoleophilaceae bacterium]
MTPAPGTFLRLAALVLFGVVLQISGVASIHIFGTQPNLVPLIVGAIALLGGSLYAAGVGFACGLLIDLALGQPVGASSLVLTAVGYAVGRYQEVRDPAHGLMPIPIGAAATAGYVIGFAALSFMLEVRGPVSASVIREMIITILLNALLALLVFPIIRRFMRATLVGDDRARRRQPHATTGPLGLRGLEI